MAFKNSTGSGGISVISADCASEKSSGICEHISSKAVIKSTDPPLFWKFDSKILPPNGHRIELDDSEGDPCHYNIKDISNNGAKNLFKRNKTDNIFRCSGGTPIATTEEEIAQLIRDNQIKL